MVRDVSEQDFERDVIERSRAVPVVVDFWAAWCGPCRALGPILESEVRALGGRVELAKVDTDANPAVSARFDIRSIPRVIAFSGGRAVDEFVGAQPAAAVRAFLGRLVPSPDQEALARARALVEARRPPSEIEAALAAIDPRSPEGDEAQALRALLALHAAASSYGGEEKARAALAANEGDLDARWALACALAAKFDLAGALEQFLDLVSRSRKYRDDGARRAMLTVFAWLGDSDLAREFRRKLQVVT